MKNLTFACVLLGWVLLVQSCDDAQRAKNFNEKALVDADGLEFVKAASEAGLTEVKASALAETMSKNLRVIKFAKMMLADHTNAGSELSELAKGKLIDIADTLSLNHQKTIDSLARLTNGFDEAYMGMMLKDHIKVVGLFVKAGSNRNSAVQKFAKKTLPVLKMHLDSARAIKASLK